MTALPTDDSVAEVWRACGARTCLHRGIPSVNDRKQPMLRGSTTSVSTSLTRLGQSLGSAVEQRHDLAVAAEQQRFHAQVARGTGCPRRLPRPRPVSRRATAVSAAAAGRRTSRRGPPTSAVPSSRDRTGATPGHPRPSASWPECNHAQRRWYVACFTLQADNPPPRVNPPPAAAPGSRVVDVSANVVALRTASRRRSDRLHPVRVVLGEQLLQSRLARRGAQMTTTRNACTHHGPS